jgi:hypothetical protein
MHYGSSLGAGAGLRRAQMGREQMVTKERTGNAASRTGDWLLRTYDHTETGLDIGLLADLALKALYYEGTTTAGQLGSLLALSQPVMQEVMEFLNRGKLCEVLGSEGHGPTSYRYSLTGSGVARAAAAFERKCTWSCAGPYRELRNQVRQQSISRAV